MNFVQISKIHVIVFVFVFVFVVVVVVVVVVGGGGGGGVAAPVKVVGFGTFVDAFTSDGQLCSNY